MNDLETMCPISAIKSQFKQQFCIYLIHTLHFHDFTSAILFRALPALNHCICPSFMV